MRHRIALGAALAAAVISGLSAPSAIAASPRPRDIPNNLQIGPVGKPNRKKRRAMAKKR